MIVAICTYYNSNNYYITFNSGYTGYTTSVIDNGDGTSTITYEHTILPSKMQFGGSSNAGIEKAKLLKRVDYMDVSELTTCDGMFHSCSKLESIDTMNGNFSKVTSMRNMFYDTLRHIDIDFASWDVSNVTDMSGLFQRIRNTTLDIADWDVSNVTDMSSMFMSCQTLTSLDLSKWDTRRVTDMHAMFSLCYSLSDLNVDNLVTDNVTTLSRMFYACYNLIDLDLSTWNTSSVLNMSETFRGCKKLESIDLSSWSTKNATNISDMFNGCSSLTKLDVSNFDTSQVTNMASMFHSCSKLTELDLKNWDTSKVTNMSSMFHSCGSLTELNVNNWDTSNVTNMASTFISCSGLTDLDLSNWNTNKVTSMFDMFSGCHKLLSLNISNFNINGANTNTMLNNCWVLRKVNLSNSSPATVSTIVSLLPNRSADNKCYIFARVEVPNQKYWETILCKDSSVTVSLPQPLNKIKDVSDRLYWDEDKGHYCIQREVGKVVFNGSESWYTYAIATDTRLTTFQTMHVSNIRIINSSDIYAFSNTRLLTSSNSLVPGFNINNYTGKNIYACSNYDSLSEFKADLAKNPVTIYYLLNQPEIIDLPHLNKKYSLDTYMPTTYLECSNSPMQPSKMYFETDKLKYKPLVLETNKDYTIQFECSKNSDTNVKVVLGGVEEEIEAVVGTNHINITTPEELSSDRLYMSGQGNKVSDVMLVDGDMKQYPEYFDGIESVGELQEDGKYKIEIETHNFSPLFYNGKNYGMTIGKGSPISFGDTIKINSGSLKVLYTPVITLKAGQYLVARITSATGGTNHTCQINKPEGSKIVGNSAGNIANEISSKGYYDFKATVNETTTGQFSFRFDFGTYTIESITVVDGENVVFTSNIQSILSPKPLRKVGDVADRIYWDHTLEKYCIERNVGVITYTGDETWTVQTLSSDYNDVASGFYTSIENAQRTTTDTSLVINDGGFICYSDAVYSYKPKAIGINRSGRLYLSLYNDEFGYDGVANSATKLSLFKEYLSNNPVTVYYSYTTPIIEEVECEGEVVNLPRLYQREETCFNVTTGNLRPSNIMLEYKNI